MVRSTSSKNFGPTLIESSSAVSIEASGRWEWNSPPKLGKAGFKLLGSLVILLPFGGMAHFLVHSWTTNCYLVFQSEVLVAIRAA